ncbi:NUDIX domain-containing protein [Glycomyces sp. L485]|uniref:NUDIX domain-containing protein n=1 Tax=Glycomyces sp. L485 TaxID=2909235 RepID=UPI001F4B7657|nr:NUDIX domain-containing protein [Glycomyces sp. L485]MCH7229418.1 NUDIX domain-containing protein [Glycomyces sp. L485]
MSIQRYGKWDFRAVDRDAAARARARLQEQGAPAEPERAAAVVLLREAPLRVFLLRHTAKEPFGAVAEGEHAPLETVRERWADAEADYGSAGERHRRGSRYGFPGGRFKPDDPDVAMTGVREVEEETGAMVALQRAWSRWVTPEYEPVRFDAWIYVATLAEGFQPRIRAREPEYMTWIGPEQAVCQYGGQMSMPEATTLAELSRYSTVGEVFAAAEQRDMSPILPRLGTGWDHPRLVLPGEEGYPEASLSHL